MYPSLRNAYTNRCKIDLSLETTRCPSKLGHCNLKLANFIDVNNCFSVATCKYQNNCSEACAKLLMIRALVTETIIESFLWNIEKNSKNIVLYKWLSKTLSHRKWTVRRCATIENAPQVILVIRTACETFVVMNPSVTLAVNCCKTQTPLLWTVFDLFYSKLYNKLYN